MVVTRRAAAWCILQIEFFCSLCEIAMKEIQDAVYMYSVGITGSVPTIALKTPENQVEPNKHSAWTQ